MFVIYYLIICILIGFDCFYLLYVLFGNVFLQFPHE